jgi:phage gpG-like protein
MQYFEIDASKAIKDLTGMRDKAQNMPWILGKVKHIVKESTEQAFQTESNASDHKYWKRSGLAISENRKTLYQTGALFNDMLNDKNYWIKDDTLSQVSTLIYAPVHNFGLEHPVFNTGRWYKEPVRQFAGMDKYDLDRLNNTILGLLNFDYNAGMN